MACSRSDSQPNTPCLAHGDADMKRCSATGLALESDGPAVLLFDNLSRNCKSHAGAFADSFRSEPRVEGFPLLLGSHSAARVGDRDVDEAAFSVGADGDLSFTL